MYINTTQYTGTGATIHAFETSALWLGNRSTGTEPSGAKIGIVAIYDRALSEVEVNLVYDLIYHWVFNGSPPATGNPLSGSFTCTSSDPDNSTYSWNGNYFYVIF